MSHKFIITKYQNGIASMLHDGRRAVSLSFYEEDARSLVGNIYVGKVSGIVKNIQAAFVEIEDGISCYYSIPDNPDPIYTSAKTSASLAVGDELLVQVSRDSVKKKPPTVTANLSLSGKYLVLTAHRKQVSASLKLDPQRRRELLETMEPFADREFGWIVRTNASDAGTGELLAEAQLLSDRYRRLTDTAPHRTCRSCLYRTPALWLKQIQDTYDAEYEQILTDDEELYGQLQDYLAEEMPSVLNRLSLYRDRLLPLSVLYALESAFEEALRERVWLKSGAYLVIQPTEALTVIDVNTGKYERGKKQQETFYKINAEAAHEIARQVRLRNLSGMILIDFINMDSDAQKKELMRLLDEDLRRDPIKACVVDMTRLGLVEVTRKRIRKPLAETMHRM